MYGEIWLKSGRHYVNTEEGGGEIREATRLLVSSRNHTPATHPPDSPHLFAIRGTLIIIIFCFIAQLVPGKTKQVFPEFWGVGRVGDGYCGADGGTAPG